MIRTTNARGLALNLRRSMTAVSTAGATAKTPAPRGPVATMRQNVGVPARPLPPNPKYAPFGSSPRTSTAQGIHPLTVAQIPRLQSQILHPAPFTLHYKPSTARPSGTAPFNAAPTARHAGTQTGKYQMTVHAGPMPQPLMVGSKLSLGRTTVRIPIVRPPQQLIPIIMAKVYNPRGK